MVIIEGYIRDSSGQPLSRIPVEAFQHHPFNPFNLLHDSNLTSIPEVTEL